MQVSALAQHFLVRDTSLALQIGHRKSIDLDLFTHHTFNAEAVLAILQSQFHVQPLTITNTIFISVIEGIKVDFVYFRYPFAFPIIEEEGTRLADKRDIAPMKLDAVTKRGSKKDFNDMYYLLEEFSLQQILEWYNAMFQHATSFHVIRSLTYFEDAESTDAPFVFDKKVTWGKVKKRMIEIVKNNI